MSSASRVRIRPLLSVVIPAEQQPRIRRRRQRRTGTPALEASQERRDVLDLLRRAPTGEAERAARVLQVLVVSTQRIEHARIREPRAGVVVEQLDGRLQRLLRLGPALERRLQLAEIAVTAPRIAIGRNRALEPADGAVGVPTLPRDQRAVVV